jgi:hypothetical protein
VGTGPRPAVGSVLAATVFILAASVPARGEIERPHSFAFKVGYHAYPNSSYFDATEAAGAGGAQDLSGLSLEIFDYTYQWPSRWSLNASLLGGYYQEFVPSQANQQSLFVHTMTVTPLYRLAGSDAIGAWQVYTGVGLGRYGASIRFDFASTAPIEIHTYTLGYQALIGTEYRYSEHTGFLVEGKFSRARIRFSTEELGNLEVDAGGINILAGVRIHF